MPNVEGVTHSYIDTGKIRMHVAQAGAGDPVLMLHGWPQNWYAFRHLIPELAKDYRVIAPDLRGWGWTDAPPAGYEKRQLVKDVFALLDALEIRGDLRLIGHDWGSIVGFMLCLERPELVSRYLVMGGGHLWPKRDVKFALALRRFWYQALIGTPFIGQRLVADRRFIQLLYRTWSPNRQAWTDADMDALTKQFEEPARARATVLTYRTWITREFPALGVTARRHEPLPMPILFLQGERDGCIDPVVVRIDASGRNAPNMTLEILPGVGHFVPEEVPDVVLARARQFFK